MTKSVIAIFGMYINFIYCIFAVLLAVLGILILLKSILRKHQCFNSSFSLWAILSINSTVLHFRVFFCATPGLKSVFTIVQSDLNVLKIY